MLSKGGGPTANNHVHRPAQGVFSALENFSRLTTRKLRVISQLTAKLLSAAAEHGDHASQHTNRTSMGILGNEASQRNSRTQLPCFSARNSRACVTRLLSATAEHSYHASQRNSRACVTRLLSATAEHG